MSVYVLFNKNNDKTYVCKELNKIIPKVITLNEVVYPFDSEYGIPKFYGKYQVLCVVDNAEHEKYIENKPFIEIINLYTNDLYFEPFQHSYDRFKTNLEASVIVFDIDDTVVDEQNKPFADDLNESILKLRSIFDYIGVWSHGTTNHILPILKKLLTQYDVHFDFVITRDDCIQNKSAAQILNIVNQKFDISQLSFSVLIDDTISNFAEDYDLFIHIKSPPTSFNDIAETILDYTRRYKNKIN